MLELFCLSIFTGLKSGNGLVKTDVCEDSNLEMVLIYMQIEIWKWSC